MEQGRTQDKIGPQEICILIVFVSLSHLLWPKNNRLYDTPGHSVWISALLSMVFGLIMVFAIIKYTHGKGLAGALCESYGKVLGNAFVLVFALYFLSMVSSLLARTESEMAYFAYTATDKTIMRVVFALAMTFVAGCGIAGVSRTARFGMIVLIFLAVLLVVFSARRPNPVRIHPILGDGISSVATASLELAGAYWSVFAVAALSLHTGKKKKLGRGAVLGIVISSLSLTFIFLIMISSVSSRVYEQSISPMLYFTSILRAGKYMNKVDSIFISAWVSLAVITGAFGMQCSSILMARATGTKTTKPYTVGAGGVCIVLSSQLQYHTNITELLKLAWIPAVLIIIVGIIITSVRRRYEKN